MASRFVPSLLRRGDIFIGIDPDCDKSGYARLDKRSGTLALANYSFVELLSQLSVDKERYEGSCVWSVVVEAGYLEAKTQHHYFGDNPRIAARVGQKVGRNHETARKIIEVCEFWGIPCYEAEPLRLIWGEDRNSKISASEFNALTGYKKRTNPEVRDAALLAWVAAGFSMNISMR